MFRFLFLGLCVTLLASDFCTADDQNERFERLERQMDEMKEMLVWQKAENVRQNAEIRKLKSEINRPMTGKDIYILIFFLWELTFSLASQDLHVT